MAVGREHALSDEGSVEASGRHQYVMLEILKLVAGRI